MKANQSNATAQACERIERMTAFLKDYARRGVFRGFSCQRSRGSKASFAIVWHRNREFELAFDAATSTLRFPRLLVDVPADSPMYHDLKNFVRSRQVDDLPEHRRIDTHKALAQVHNRKGRVSLVVESKDGDDLYAARKLVHLANEVFMTFLVEGNYFEYMVEAFDLDPDRM